MSGFWSQREKRLQGDSATLPSNSVVYFITCDEMCAVKIGVTTNLTMRLSSLSSSMPVSYRVVGWLRGTAELESRLHKKFSAWRLRGEWFRWTSELRSFAHAHLVRPVALTLRGDEIRPLPPYKEPSGQYAAQRAWEARNRDKVRAAARERMRRLRARRSATEDHG